MKAPSSLKYLILMLAWGGQRPLTCTQEASYGSSLLVSTIAAVALTRAAIDPRKGVRQRDTLSTCGGAMFLGLLSGYALKNYNSSIKINPVLLFGCALTGAVAGMYGSWPSQAGAAASLITLNKDLSTIHSTQLPQHTLTWWLETAKTHDQQNSKTFVATEEYRRQLKETTSVLDHLLKNRTGKSTLSASDSLYYAEKVIVPSSSQELYWISDIRGDLPTLTAILEKLHQEKLITDDFSVASKATLIFTGNYVDLENNGTEVLYILARLKARNPHQVFLLRGFHEQWDINKKPQRERGGFADEVRKKFGTTFEAEHKAFYTMLPSTLYYGTTHQNTTNYIQFVKNDSVVSLK